SLEDPELAFVLIQPHIFLTDYKPLIPPTELKTIGLNSVENAVLFLIVTIPASDPKKMTANLQGPILIHPDTRIAKQFISRDENHPLRRLILDTEESEK
ncbi:MAG TPA: flagellar assembly protein FliW, partial [Leptospiraceae bacterium]|nr:flagellar assembly protein FliW [Leptospiraceae bacterium]